MISGDHDGARLNVEVGGTIGLSREREGSLEVLSFEDMSAEVVSKSSRGCIARSPAGWVVGNDGDKVGGKALKPKYVGANDVKESLPS